MWKLVVTPILVAGLAGGAEPSSADAPTLEEFKANLERMTRDGSWWFASNADYAQEDGEGAFESYGVRNWVEQGGISAGGCLWGMREASEPVVFWRFYQGWDFARGEPFFYQAHTSGTISGMGGPAPDGESDSMVQAFASAEADGVNRVRHDSEWLDDDTHVTYSADRVDGTWQPRRTYTWHRRTDGEPPCGPVR